jgi:hypothetical protein
MWEVRSCRDSNGSQPLIHSKPHLIPSLDNNFFFILSNGLKTEVEQHTFLGIKAPCCDFPKSVCLSLPGRGRDVPCRTSRTCVIFQVAQCLPYLHEDPPCPMPSTARFNLASGRVYFDGYGIMFTTKIIATRNGIGARIIKIQVRPF